MAGIDIQEMVVALQDTPRLKRQRPSIRRADSSLNLLDAQYVEAVHIDAFGAQPPSRAKWVQWLSWRFRGHNVDPGGLQGGLARGAETTINEWADALTANIAARWHDRRTWRNKAHLSDFVQATSSIGLTTPSWMPFATPRHIKAYHRRAMWQARLAGDYYSQEFLPIIVPVLAPTVPLGVANITGGGLTV